MRKNTHCASCTALTARGLTTCSPIARLTRKSAFPACHRRILPIPAGQFGYRNGWANDSQQLNMALCRGAATLQNKSWGVMITWAYGQPPYMENGTQLYSDMISAYENGAEYIIVFDSNANYTQNVLTLNQLAYMKQFLAVCSSQPQNHHSSKR